MENQRFRLQIVLTLAVGGVLALGVAGCGRSEAPAPSEPSTARSSPPVAQPEAEATTPAPTEPTSQAPSPPAQRASAETPAASPKQAPAGGDKGVSDPGGAIAVASTKSGLTHIGADKCKVCHKVQYASWAETAHAKRDPPLDCESCHGDGSEYKSMAVMKDPAKAKAAGLVMPDASFCKTCHKQGWKDDQLKKVHAHKAA